jgi:hypothetical protein
MYLKETFKLGTELGFYLTKGFEKPPYYPFPDLNLPTKKSIYKSTMIPSKSSAAKNKDYEGKHRNGFF